MSASKSNPILGAIATFPVVYIVTSGMHERKWQKYLNEKRVYDHRKELDSSLGSSPLFKLQYKPPLSDSALCYGIYPDHTSTLQRLNESIWAETMTESSAQAVAKMVLEKPNAYALTHFIMKPSGERPIDRLNHRRFSPYSKQTYWSVATVEQDQYPDMISSICCLSPAAYKRFRQKDLLAPSSTFRPGTLIAAEGSERHYIIPNATPQAIFACMAHAASSKIAHELWMENALVKMYGTLIRPFLNFLTGVTTSINPYSNQLEKALLLDSDSALSILMTPEELSQRESLYRHLGNLRERGLGPNAQTIEHLLNLWLEIGTMDRMKRLMPSTASWMSDYVEKRMEFSYSEAVVFKSAESQKFTSTSPTNG